MGLHLLPQVVSAKRLLALTILFVLLMVGSAPATLRGVEPNSWDYTPAQWSSFARGLNPQVVRIEHQWDAPLSALDSKVNAAGSTPILLLDGTVAPDPAAYAKVAAQVALRYRGRNRGIEIWNEENTARFWGKPPNVVEYATLLRTAYTAIKIVAPETRVILGGPAATSDAPIWAHDVLARAPADAVGVHPYAPTPYWSEQTVRRFHDYTRKPLSVTEFGWGTGCPEAGFCVDETTQAGYLIEALNRFHSLGYVTDATVYELQDTDGACSRWDCLAGLVRGDGSLKPAYLRYRDWNPPVSPTVPVSPSPTQPRVTLRLRHRAYRVRARGYANGCSRVRVVLRRAGHKRVVYAPVSLKHYRRVVRRLHAGRYYVRSRCSTAKSRLQAFRVVRF